MRTVRLYIDIGWIVVLIGLATVVPGSSSRCGDNQAKVKAKYVELLTRHVTWPVDAVGDTFVVGIYGESDFFDALREHHRFMIKDRPVEIERLRDPAAAADADIVLIGSATDSLLTAILVQIRSKPVLTIGDSEGYAARGVQINMYVEDGAVRFEINPDAMSRSSLRVSHHLYRMSRIVRE